METHDSPAAPSSPLVASFLEMLGAYRTAVAQERVFLRLALLSVGSVLTLGRHTVSQVLVSLGAGDQDWTAWYRLFNRARIDVAAVQSVIVTQLLAVWPTTGAIVAAVDATQLPRTSRRLPGVGWTVQARTPKWRRGIHLAQRYVGVSGLLPRSGTGESRAVPLGWLPLRTARTTPLGAAPERTESGGAGELIRGLRHHLDAHGRGTQPLLVLGDGAYSNRGMLTTLPPRTVLFARCAKNRALFAVPSWHPGRGRPRRYGDQGPTPQQTLHTPDGWHDETFAVRGRQVTVTVTATGPWLLRGAPFTPVLLIVVRGVDRGRGTTRRQRDPQYFLASVVMTSEEEWTLPVPMPELLAWAWQRWEVEVMHRELKSSFGIGEPQLWSHRGAATVVPWLLAVYALLILAAYRTWGYAPPPGPDRGGWWHPRRWSIGRALQQSRADLWRLADFQPTWQRTPDAWAEMAAWSATWLPTVLGGRRL